MQRVKRRRKRQGQFRRLRGAVLAEAALVMTLLCMVTLGALQYGWFFYCLHTATNAARQGARVEATLDGEGHGTAALLAQLPDLLEGIATTKVVTATTDIEGRPCVRGEVIIPAGSVALLPISFLPVPDCRATVTMAKEGVPGPP